jgi:hypothetical protein
VNQIEHRQAGELENLLGCPPDIQTEEYRLWLLNTRKGKTDWMSRNVDPEWLKYAPYFVVFRFWNPELRPHDQTQQIQDDTEGILWTGALRLTPEWGPCSQRWYLNVNFIYLDPPHPNIVACKYDDDEWCLSRPLRSTALDCFLAILEQGDSMEKALTVFASVLMKAVRVFQLNDVIDWSSIAVFMHWETCNNCNRILSAHQTEIIRCTSCRIGACRFCRSENDFFSKDPAEELCDTCHDRLGQPCTRCGLELTREDVVHSPWADVCKSCERTAWEGG